MGKGDKRTKRGKLWRGSHGKMHPGSPKDKTAKNPPPAKK